MLKKLKKAFTITELVIVIAVIAILAAVLIPTFANVIENANQSAALQTCTNALTDYQSIALNDDNDENDDMTGVVFVSNDYAYVYLNSSLHYIGKTSDMCYVTSGADVNGEDKLSGITNLTFTAPVSEAPTMTFTYTSDEEPTESSFTLATLEVDGESGKRAENIYFYTVELNNTNYFGWFTMEVGENPAYQTQGASYSRQYVYANISAGSMEIAFV